MIGMNKDVIDEINALAEYNVKLRKTDTNNYYKSLREASSRHIPVVHSTALGPQEIYYAMDILPFFPENYDTICSAKQLSPKFLDAAEQKGISPDTCSYARLGLGMMYLNDGPYGPMPKPDFIVSYPHFCDAYAGWWEIESEHYNVPIFYFDGPFIPSGNIKRHHINWMVEQFKDLISFIESVTAHKFDYDKFKEVMQLSAKTTELAWKVHEMRKAKPCPRGLREGLGDLFYLITLLGTKTPIQYYESVLKEIEMRVSKHIGVGNEEKYRLFWFNPPLWYNLQLIDYLSDCGANLVMDHYSAMIWMGYQFDGGHIDPNTPFETLAMDHLSRNGIVGMKHEINRYVRAINEWGCDGVVVLSNKGCPIHNRNLFAKFNEVKAKTSVPVMIFEAEMADPRTFVEKAVMKQVDTFLEILNERRLI